MKQQEMVTVNETNDWTKINLEDYDFDNVALQEAQYIFECSTLPFDGSELKDRVDEFNEMYKTNATIKWQGSTLKDILGCLQCYIVKVVIF